MAPCQGGCHCLLTLNVTRSHSGLCRLMEVSHVADLGLGCRLEWVQVRVQVRVRGGR